MATSSQLSENTNWSYFSNYTRSGERYNSWPIGQITSVQFHIKKVGSPTGTAYARVYKVSDGSLLGTLGSLAISSLTTSYVWYTFSSAEVDIASVMDIRIVLETPNGDASNYVASSKQSTNVTADGVSTYWNGSAWTDDANTDNTWQSLTWNITVLPTVATSSPATGIGANGATLGGSVSSDGYGTMSDYGFIWKKTSAPGDPGNVSPATNPGGSIGWANGSYTSTPFSHVIASLDTGSVYYFRAAAKNQIGWDYGSAVMFTTLFTHRISNADTQGIKAGGELVADTAKVYIIDDLDDTISHVHPTSGFYTNDVYGASGVYPHVHAVCIHEVRATLAATNITYTAVKNPTGAPLYFPGGEGNKIRVKHTSGGSLSVAVTDNRGTTGFYDVEITILVGTTTATLAAAALAAHAQTKYVVSGSTGSGMLAVQDYTALSGGKYYTSTAHAFVTPTEI